jgi:hypothetical protein
MAQRIKISTSLVVMILALVATSDAFGVAFCPLRGGQNYLYTTSDPLGNRWPVRLEIDGPVEINSLDYYHLQAFNNDNDSGSEDWGYARSSEDILYSYNPDGNDFIEHRKAPIGTKWSFYQQHDGGYNYKVLEIVDVNQVTVPFGTFSQSYKTRRYRCVDPNDLDKGKSPDWYEWIVPGVGRVKQEDYWVDGPAPWVTELERIYYDDYEAAIAGEYWFGSLSADADTWEPWAKSGTVVINGNNWDQQWDDYAGHHSFSDIFSLDTQLDNSMNIEFSESTYSVAWNGNMLVHANNSPDADNRLGIDIMVRRAKNVDVNDFIGDYSFFGHWLGWDSRWAEVQWGNAHFDANGTVFMSYVSSDGYSDSFTSTWTLDDVNGIVYAGGTSHPAFLCEGGIMTVFQNVDTDSLGYDIFVKRTAATITPEDISGTYLFRFLETSVFGEPFTCGTGTAMIRPDGTYTMDAWFSDGEHNVFNANYMLGPGNQIQIVSGSNVHEGIISPDLGLIFAPEYQVPENPTDDDWIGGCFLIRAASNIADLNEDMLVDFIDYAAFANQWLNEEAGLPGDFDDSGQVNWLDLKVFAESWLWQVSWWY